MEKRTYRSLCAVSLSAALVSVALVAWVFFGYITEQIRGELVNEAYLLLASMEQQDDPVAYLASLEGSGRGLRVTYLDGQGTVLYDSNRDAALMESHATRSEVRDALEKGEGTAMRTSQTLGQFTYYYALRGEDGNVLRVSRDSDELARALLNLLPILCAVVLGLIFLCTWVSSRLTKRIMRPLESLLGQGANPRDEDTYPELVPLSAQIRRQNQQIAQQIETLRSERDTIAAITGHMQEGLVLLDPQGKILSVNESAITLLGARRYDYVGQHMAALFRSQELHDLVAQALQGENGSLAAQSGERTCRVLANPVYTNEVMTGAIVLIMDITQSYQAEVIRRDFSANVSHELKNPLTSISGYAEMLAGSDLVIPEADRQRFAQRIHDESVRLIRLIDDIIRLSRIEEKADTHGEPLDLYQLCKDTLEQLAPLAQRDGITLQLEGGPTPVWANPPMMQELVFNLCDNAVKYNVASGRVEVRLERSGKDGVALTVSDTGIGIPSGHQDRVFERFYRVDKSRSKKIGGTGLGLSIVKHIVEVYNGTCELASAEGEGTRICVTLPGIYRPEGEVGRE